MQNTLKKLLAALLCLALLAGVSGAVFAEDAVEEQLDLAFAPEGEAIEIVDDVALEAELPEEDIDAALPEDEAIVVEGIDEETVVSEDVEIGEGLPEANEAPADEPETADAPTDPNHQGDCGFIRNPALSAGIASNGTIKLNSTNVPNATFRTYLIDEVFDGNSTITTADAAELTAIWFGNQGTISTMKGIELFPNLEYLTCYLDGLTSLDISKNTKLEYLDCSLNDIDELDIGNCPHLVKAYESGEEEPDDDYTTYNYNDDYKLCVDYSTRISTTGTSATPTLKVSSLTLGVKEKYSAGLVASDSPVSASDCKFTSSDKTIATVSSAGVVTAKKVGSAKITVTSKAYGTKATCKVTVKKAPGKVTVSPTSKTLKVGESFSVTYKLPSNTQSRAMTFTSSNAAVATVNSKGKVTAKKAGKATITVKAFNGKKGTCKVTVKAANTTKYRALMIGQNNYSDSPLQGCVNDANALHGVFASLSNNFVTNKVLTNQSAKGILNGIKTYLGSAGDNDVSIFCYSGHGVDAGGGSYQGALCGVNDTFITTAQLAKALKAVKGKVIVIIDACHSGALINKKGQSSASAKAEADAFAQSFIDAFAGEDVTISSNAAEFRTSKFTVLVAAKFTESSYDGYFDGSGHPQGKFTAALVKGMGCKYPKGKYGGSTPADSNKDKKVTLGELYNYIKKQVKSWGGYQTTQYYGNTSFVMFNR